MPAAEWYAPESLTGFSTTAAAEWYIVAAEWAAFLRRYGHPTAAVWTGACGGMGVHTLYTCNLTFNFL